MAQTKKLAIIFHANLEDRKGQTNATISRIKHLNGKLPFNIKADAICTSYYNGKILNLVRRSHMFPQSNDCFIDGININIEWLRFSLFDYILKFKLHKVPYFLNKQIDRVINRIKGYDLVSAHSFLAGEYALELYKKFGIPYCVTWHGSDIHTMPFESDYFFSRVKEIIENASVNFFVSSALMRKSNEITKSGRKMTLYNGFSDSFELYPIEKKKQLRKTHALNTNHKVVAFVGNLIPVKNASLLPSIFSNIKKQLQDRVEFWIIGDGALRKSIEEGIRHEGLNESVKLFGNIPHSQMPDLMNCIDLLLLPSVNEGLPLVTVEASRCGAMVIGSDVGGISEAIGNDNVIALGEDFVSRFSDRCVSALNGNYTFAYNQDLDWKKTAEREVEVYTNLLENS